MPGTTIRAAVSREFGQPLHIEELNLRAPGEGEVRVKVAAVAICHSDIFYMDGDWGGHLPAVFGHEAAGVVAEVGDAADDLAIGDRVVVTLVRSCGTCHQCARGNEVACSTKFPLNELSPLTDQAGTSIAQGLFTGAFAEQVVVHRSQLVALRGATPLDSSSLLACGVITGVGAVLNTAEVREGSHVVVIGTGGVGLNVVQGARIAGAATITAIDLNPDKLVAARQMGATHTVDGSVYDGLAQVKAITDGLLADYVFVAAGSVAAVDSAYQLVAPMGALVVVGMPPTGHTSPLDTGGLAARNQRVLGSKMGSSVIADDIPKLESLYHDGTLVLDDLVSGRFSLDDINDAVDSVRRGEALRSVVIVDPDLVSSN